MEFLQRAERKRERERESKCDGGKALNLYLIHAVAAMCPHTLFHISSTSHAHSHKVPVVCIWLGMHAWLCTCIRSHCSKPIRQSESVHKFLQLALWRSEHSFSASLSFDRCLLPPSVSMHSPVPPCFIRILSSSTLVTLVASGFKSNF